MKKVYPLLFYLCSVFLFFLSGIPVFAQTETITVTPSISVSTPTPTPAVTLTPTATPTPSINYEQINKLQAQINEYESKVTELQGKSKTLSSQINLMDNQIKITELRIQDMAQKINVIEEDINVTKNKISQLEVDINQTTKALLNRIVAVYQVGSIEPWQVFLTSDSVSNFFSRLKYLRIVQMQDKKNVYASEQSKINYAHLKSMLEEKQKQQELLKKKLEGYTSQLNNEKKAKEDLLSQTQGSEKNYQQLLAQAKAQLAAFSRFTQNQGGASLLSNQTACDDWGCYYNQRDSSWGGLSLNGTQYSLASDGCLVTSMAMMYTHYGHRSVTPLTINSISQNFASYYPAWLNKSISADGASSTRIGADIDSTLASGHPVVVGISYDGGSLADHFVVFVSGSNGNYIMNDPFTPNGHNISFRNRYPSARIVEVEKVNFN